MDLNVVRLSDSVVPEDVGTHAVSPEARCDYAGLGHEGDEVVAEEEEQEDARLRRSSMR